MELELKKTNNCNLGISVLRIIATFSVVLIHACTAIIDNNLLADENIISIYIEKFCRWSVPVFIMITGNLFLNKTGKFTYTEIFKKYILRILGVLFVFGIPLAFLARLLDSGFDWNNVVIYIGQAFFDILQNQGPDHLWYLYMLIGIYMVIPVLKVFTDNCSLKQQYVLILILFICNFVFELLNSVYKIDIAFYIPMEYELFYLLIGKNIINIKTSIESKISNKHLFFILVVLLFVLSATAFLLISDNGYHSPFCAIMAFSVFVLFSGIKVSDKVNKILWTLDRLCFGVYIFHPLWIQLAYKVLKIVPQNCIELILFTIIFAILSFITCVIARAIKPIRKIL